METTKVYYIHYRDFKVDKYPVIYTLFSNNEDTMVLNIHYLVKIFNPNFYRHKNKTLEQTVEQLRRLRKHPALMRFFQFIESRKFDSMSYETRYRIISKQWPKITKATIRHYKTNRIRVLWSEDKDNLDVKLNEYKF